MKFIINPQYRRDYKAGDIFFSYNNESIISKGIALFTSEDRVSSESISHCGIIVGKNLCIEADEKLGYVVISNFKEKYLEQKHKTVMIKRPVCFSGRYPLNAIMHSYAMVGRKYNYRGILRAAIRILMFWKRRKNIDNYEPRVFCSQMVATILRRACGPVGCLQNDSDDIYPQTLFEDKELFQDWDMKIIHEKESEGVELS